jgi:hypothetical protein
VFFSILIECVSFVHCIHAPCASASQKRVANDFGSLESKHCAAVKIQARHRGMRDQQRLKEDDERKHCGGGCKEALWRRMQGSTVEEDARKHCGGGCKEALWRRKNEQALCSLASSSL